MRCGPFLGTYYSVIKASYWKPNSSKQPTPSVITLLLYYTPQLLFSPFSLTRDVSDEIDFSFSSADPRAEKQHLYS